MHTTAHHQKLPFSVFTERAVVLPRSLVPPLVQILRECAMNDVDQLWWDALVFATLHTRIPMDLKHTKAPEDGWAWAPGMINAAMKQAWTTAMTEKQDGEVAYRALMEAAQPERENQSEVEQTGAD